MWGEIKKERQEKKWRNEKLSLDILRERRVEFEVLSEESAHYRVGQFDFWPTTGKFYNQRTGEGGRGVYNLLEKIGV